MSRTWFHMSGPCKLSRASLRLYCVRHDICPIPCRLRPQTQNRQSRPSRSLCQQNASRHHLHPRYPWLGHGCLGPVLRSPRIRPGDHSDVPLKGLQGELLGRLQCVLLQLLHLLRQAHHQLGRMTGATKTIWAFVTTWSIPITACCGPKGRGGIVLNASAPLRLPPSPTSSLKSIFCTL